MDRADDQLVGLIEALSEGFEVLGWIAVVAYGLLLVFAWDWWWLAGDSATAEAGKFLLVMFGFLICVSVGGQLWTGVKWVRWLGLLSTVVSIAAVFVRVH